MIVRTYGRRNRGGGGVDGGDLTRTSSQDSFDDDPFPISQEITTASNSQDFFNSFPFSSQESTSYSLNPDPFSFDDDSLSNGVVVPTKPKKSRKSKFERPPSNKNWKNSRASSFVTTAAAASTTLMEAQEIGEMMEHVDEVNFALDGLKKGQPLRIRRASLLSLLGICGTNQQRRLLRAQGISKTIIDAILALSFDDYPSNLAAAALFYVLTNDGQDEHILESPTCIRFLTKLLKPIISTATEDKARNIGGKLLALRKDPDILRDSSKLADSSSASIVAKVQEILINCKDLKSSSVNDSRTEKPELSPKWIALLSMEKACLSKISFEDTSGIVRKTGGNFKEKLRELGGLDAVFEVAVNCHSVLERWTEHNSPSIHGAKDDAYQSSLVLLLKCLKIMENATFLSNDNQNHLLGMKGNPDSYGHRISFTKLVISVIKILSSLYQIRSSPSASDDENCCNLSDRSDHASDLALIDDYRVDSDGVICISSDTSCFGKDERMSSEKRLNASQKSIAQLSLTASNSETGTAFMNNTCQLKMRAHSTSSSCSEKLRSFDSNGSRAKSGLVKRPNCTKDAMHELLDDGEDPFAFDEDDFQPSKWDLLSGKRKISPPHYGRVTSRELEDGFQYQLMSQEESSNGETCQQKLSNDEHHLSQKSSHCNFPDKEQSSLLTDCLLTAVKVLMNLTNENPIGCRQIAACGGLETMSSLIAGHFPSFSSSLSFISEMPEDSSMLELENQNDIHLSDQELDLLVAILGLLVNLVEKDGGNRSRLAATSVSLSSSEGSEDENRRDVIPLLCSIFLANQGAGDAPGEGSAEPWSDEAAVLQGEKEAEKMIVEAYSALLLAFLSTESKSIRDSIADCLPDHNIAVLVPVLERFVAFHLSLNMISPETHKAVSEVIESCRIR